MWGFNSPTTSVYSSDRIEGMGGLLLEEKGDLGPAPQGKQVFKGNTKSKDIPRESQNIACVKKRLFTILSH